MSEKLWQSIEEVDAAEYGFGKYVETRPRSSGRWTALYRQILLRLEQTPRSRALAVRFKSREKAKQAKNSADWWFNRWCGPGFVEIAARTGEDGCGLLLVRRGEDYIRRKGEGEPEQPQGKLTA